MHIHAHIQYYKKCTENSELNVKYFITKQNNKTGFYSLALAVLYNSSTVSVAQRNLLRIMSGLRDQLSSVIQRVRPLGRTRNKPFWFVLLFANCCNHPKSVNLHKYTPSISTPVRVRKKTKNPPELIRLISTYLFCLKNVVNNFFLRYRESLLYFNMKLKLPN